MLILDDDTSIRKDLISFFKNPDYERFRTDSTIARIIVFVKVVLLGLLIELLANLPLIVGEYMGLFKESINLIHQNYQSLDSDGSGYMIYFLVYVVLVGPLIEEIAFRFPLKAFHLQHIKVALALIVGPVAYSSLYPVLWQPDTYWFFFSINLFYQLCFSGLVYFCLSFFESKLGRLCSIWNKRPSIVHYFFASTFALSHIFSFSIDSSQFLQVPFILFPFFMSGLILAYLRVRIGFVYSILLHIFWNGMVMFSYSAA